MAKRQNKSDKVTSETQSSSSSSSLSTRIFLCTSERKRRWDTLLKVTDINHPDFSRPKNSSGQHTGNGDDGNNNNENDDDDDNYTYVIDAPPAKRVVENILDEFCQKWKELDERKVIKDNHEKSQNDLTINNIDKSNNDSDQVNGDDDDDDRAGAGSGSGFSNKKQRKIRGGWRLSDQKLYLPEKFDYMTKLQKAPEDDDNNSSNSNGMGDQVVSILDPSKYLSYSQELWKLFASVPTFEEIEQECKDGMNLPNMSKVYSDIESATQQNMRFDGYSLSRIRMSDRHGLPASNAATISTSSSSPSSATTSTTTTTSPSSTRRSTIRIEFLKRQLKRGSSPDQTRLVMEFLGSQTLLDVHNVLVDLTEDSLWSYPVGDNNNNDTHQQQQQQEQQQQQQQNNTACSGLFFIEDTCYTNGTVDYAKPILEWLNAGGTENTARRSFLGIPQAENKIQNMDAVTLDEIPFRLGVRYYHVHHGDIEWSVFFTDRLYCIDTNTSSSSLSYPLIHDICIPTYHTPLCDACEHFVALYVTSTACVLTDGGPRLLCEHCCRSLQLFEKEPQSVQLYSVWKNEPELSLGACQDKAF